MNTKRGLFAVSVAAAAWVLFTSAVTASDELDRAKDLYRSAAYDEALTVLDALPTAAATELREAREYRVFCLVALDRKDDAKKIIADLVTADPMYAMSENEASPRVRTMFTEVRKGLLPALAQRSYADAKALFDAKDPRAAAAFDRVLVLLRDPDVAGNQTLADLATIASGFRDLSKALASVPPPAAAAPVAAAPAPPVPNPGPAPRVASSSPIIPAVALTQSVPVPQIRDEREWDGELEVTVDESGRVASARMTKPIHPVYDQQLIRAAMTWTYRPAQRDGVPTTFVVLLPIHVDTRPECTDRSFSRPCREPGAR
jgi:TonB family protein